MTSNRHNIPTEDSAILLEVGDVHSEQPLLVSHHDFVLFVLGCSVARHF